MRVEGLGGGGLGLWRVLGKHRGFDPEDMSPLMTNIKLPFVKEVSKCKREKEGGGRTTLSQAFCVFFFYLSPWVPAYCMEPT